MFFNKRGLKPAWGTRRLASTLGCAKWQKWDLNPAPLAAQSSDLVLSQSVKLDLEMRQASIGGKFSRQRQPEGGSVKAGVDPGITLVTVTTAQPGRAELDNCHTLDGIQNS